MDEYSLVIDTNVFVAAGFEPGSASARLLDTIMRGDRRMMWHRTTRRETERVLSRIPRLLDWQRFAPLFRPEWEHEDALDLAPFGAIEDPDDRKFAALAAATGSVLISNDDHLLARRDVLPVRVLKPGEFVAEQGQPTAMPRR